MTEHPVSYYAHTLRKALPPDLFAPAPSRLLWLLLHTALAAGGIFGIAHGWGGLLGKLLLTLLVGHSFAGAAFVGHEVLHGAIVRSMPVRRAAGWLGFLSVTISPTLWVAWHNRVHHGHTGEVGVDPDAYPTLAAYEKKLSLRVANQLAPGHGHVAGWFTMLIGLTGQSLQILMSARRSLGLSRREHWTCLAEWLAGLAVWAAVAIAVGPSAFLFAYVIPLMIANAILIGYIITNHSLSPHTQVNDPLLNSLSVTTSPAFEILHLQFGLHVEHHIFPSMSARHAPAVRDAIVARWPDRYQSMPILDALGRIFATPRIYRDGHTLLEPRTGVTAPTLGQAPVEDIATKAA